MSLPQVVRTIAQDTAQVWSMHARYVVIGRSGFMLLVIAGLSVFIGVIPALVLAGLVNVGEAAIGMYRIGRFLSKREMKPAPPLEMLPKEYQ